MPAVTNDRLLAQADGAPSDGWAITASAPRNPTTGWLRDSGRVRAKFFLAREDLPADADHLVRHDGYLTLSTRLNLAQPLAERRLVPFQVDERGLSALHEEFAQVRVSAFADRSKRRPPARRM